MMQNPGPVTGENNRFDPGASQYPSPASLQDTSFQPAADQTPATDAEVVARARELLATEIRGVAFRDILSALNEGSWVLDQPVTRGNLDLTRRISELNPDLRAQYTSQQQAETIKDITLSFLSFGFVELPTITFLKSVSDINDLVTQMRESGLVTVRTRVISSGVLSPRFGGPTSTSVLIHMVAITPLGQSALQV